MTNIMIVEDQSFVADAFEMTINSMAGMQVVAVEKNAEGAISTFNDISGTTPVDIILMDLRIPVNHGSTQAEAAGIDCARTIIKNSHSLNKVVKVIMLTSSSNGLFVIKSRRMGAHGYLSKNCGMPVMRNALQQVAAGGYYYEREAEMAAKSYKIENPLWEKLIKIELSEREEKVFPLIADGLSNKEMASELCIAIKTLEPILKNLRNKFDVSNNSELIIKAIELGFYDPLI